MIRWWMRGWWVNDRDMVVLGMPAQDDMPWFDVARDEAHRAEVPPRLSGRSGETLPDVAAGDRGGDGIG